MRGTRQLLQIHLVAQRHTAGVDAEDFAPPVLVRHADHDLAIEAARTAQRFVDGVGAVGGGDHDHVGARFQAIHQGQQLGDEALFRLARHAVALGSNRIDLVDEDDRGRVAARLLEHFAQALLALAIARSHDLRAVDDREIGIALVRDRLRQPRLAGSGRAVQQHALGRIDAEAGEQFGIAQRQFHHLAQLLDRVLDPADIVVIDDRATCLRFFVFGAQLDLGIFVDMDDTLGRRRDDGEPDLRQRIGGRVDHAAQFLRHVLHRLLPRRGDEIAGHQRFPEEIALQRLRRALQAHFATGGREDDTGRGARFGRGDRDVFARSGFRIGPLQPVEAHHVERLILVVSGHGDRHGGALALDFDHIAFGNAQLLEGRARQARYALPAFLLPCRCNLQPHRVIFDCSLRIGHSLGPSSIRVTGGTGRNRPLAMQMSERRARSTKRPCNACRTRKKPGWRTNRAVKSWERMPEKA